MVTGISTSCFYPLETEKALALLVEAGAKNGEVFLNSFSELEEPYLRALDRAARAGGLGILSVHPFTSGWEGSLFFSGYPRRMEDGIDLYRRFFWGAALLGADKVIFHGAPLGMEIPMEEYARRYARLDQAARELGVRLCHENVCRTVSRSAAFFRELLRFCPDAWCTLDVKQAVRAGEDPFALAAAMGDRLAHVHISDNAPGRSCLPPGKGRMDLAGLVAQLANQGYRGGLIVELYRGDFSAVEELIDSCRWLEGLPGTKNSL